MKERNKHDVCVYGGTIRLCRAHDDSFLYHAAAIIIIPHRVHGTDSLYNMPPVARAIVKAP